MSSENNEITISLPNFKNIAHKIYNTLFSLPQNDHHFAIRLIKIGIPLGIFTSVLFLYNSNNRNIDERAIGSIACGLLSVLLIGVPSSFFPIFLPLSGLYSVAVLHSQRFY